MFVTSGVSAWFRAGSRTSLADHRRLLGVDTLAPGGRRTAQEPPPSSSPYLHVLSRSLSSAADTSAHPHPEPPSQGQCQERQGGDPEQGLERPEDGQRTAGTQREDQDLVADRASDREVRGDAAQSDPSPGSDAWISARLRPGSATYVAASRPNKGADATNVRTLTASVGVIRTKNGFGITAVGTPRTRSAPSVPSPATIQKRRSVVRANVRRIAATGARYYSTIGVVDRPHDVRYPVQGITSAGPSPVRHPSLDTRRPGTDDHPPSRSQISGGTSMRR